MKILILCQRKQSDSKDKNNVLLTNKKIFKFVSILYPHYSHDYTFLTNCMSFDINSECADVRMNFNMMSIETQKWVNINNNKFNLIIMNTCPLTFFPAHFWYGMYKLLDIGGRIYMTSFTKTTGVNITSNAIMNLLPVHNDNYPFVIVPIKGIALDTINILFSIENIVPVEKFLNSDTFLLKTEDISSNSIIFSYLLDESCNEKSLVKIFPILPRELQNFILNLCTIILNYKIKGDKMLSQNLLENFN